MGCIQIAHPAAWPRAGRCCRNGPRRCAGTPRAPGTLTGARTPSLDDAVCAARRRKPPADEHARLPPHPQPQTAVRLELDAQPAVRDAVLGIGDGRGHHARRESARERESGAPEGPARFGPACLLDLVLDLGVLRGLLRVLGLRVLRLGRLAHDALARAVGVGRRRVGDDVDRVEQRGVVAVAAGDAGRPRRRGCGSVSLPAPPSSVSPIWSTSPFGPGWTSLRASAHRVSLPSPP